MDIKELNKQQLILLTLLITFVVSIATGIITVSLMQQMPKSVPQTINNVIQRTIEKVTTVQVPAKVDTSNSQGTQKETPLLGDGNVVVSIYSLSPIVHPVADTKTDVSKDSMSTVSGIPTPVAGMNSTATESTTINTETSLEKSKLGEGIIISDIGLILVETSILTDKDLYRVILSDTEFDATILKKFLNGFSILKISPKGSSNALNIENTDKKVATEVPTTASSSVDIKP